MSFERGFAIGAEDVNWENGLLVDILDELLNGFGEHIAFGGAEWPVVGGEACYAA